MQSVAAEPTASTTLLIFIYFFPKSAGSLLIYLSYPVSPSPSDCPPARLRHCSLSHCLITLYLHLFSFISPSVSYFLLQNSSIIQAFHVDLLTMALSTRAIGVVVLHLCRSHMHTPPTPPSWLQMGHSQPREEGCCCCMMPREERSFGSSSSIFQTFPRINTNITSL